MARRSRRKKKLIWLFGGVSILGIVLMVQCGRWILKNAHGGTSRAEALNNIRMIGIALTDFETDYGRFPDATTIPAVKLATKTPLSLGTDSSNQLFRQLLVTGLKKTEKPFYIETKHTTRPDDRFDTDETALAKGECGFGYIAGLSSSLDPGIPVVMSSMLPGTGKFDPSAFKGKSIVLRLDHSATPLQISRTGTVASRGADIFDPALPMWNGVKPDLKPPE